MQSTKARPRMPKRSQGSLEDYQQPQAYHHISGAFYCIVRSRPRLYNLRENSVKIDERMAPRRVYIRETWRRFSTAILAAQLRSPIPTNLKHTARDVDPKTCSLRA